MTLELCSPALRCRQNGVSNFECGLSGWRWAKKNKRPRFDLTMIAGIGEIIAERISGWWFTVMTSRYFFQYPSVDPWLVDVGGLEHEWIMTFHSVGLSGWRWVKKQQKTPFWPHHDRWDWGNHRRKNLWLMVQRYDFQVFIPVSISGSMVGGCWWFGTWMDYDFPFSWEFHTPNWRSLHDFSGRSTTNHIWCGKYHDFPIQMGDGRAFNPEEWWIQQARCGFRWLELRRDILSIRFTDSLGINTLGIQPNADLQEPMWMGIEKHPERWISSKTRFYRNHMQIFVHGDIHTKSYFARKTDVEKLPTDVFCRVILANDLCQETWSMPRNMENSINKTNHLNQVFLYPFQYFWYTKWISKPQWPFQEPKLEVLDSIYKAYIEYPLNTLPQKKNINPSMCIWINPWERALVPLVHWSWKTSVGLLPSRRHVMTSRYCFHP